MTSLQDRIENGSMPEPNSGCWIWLGAGVRYGAIRVQGKTLLAHRVSYEAFKGPIGEGLVVCHRCDNPPCVNPDHLFAATQYENVQDREAKGRGYVRPETIKVLVCGGRNYDDREKVFAVLDEIDRTRGPIRSIVHGATSGADNLAQQWAAERKRRNRPHSKDWTSLGQYAEPIRNLLMLGEHPDIVVAFQGGENTADMTQAAEREGYEVIRP